MNLEEVLSIDVVIDNAYDVKGNKGSATMITFHGESDCKNFKGIILPGGVDTQKQLTDEARILSARYILEGEDYTGEHCHIFIDNNGSIGVDGTITTRPQIFTDSIALSWMETADLTGTVTGTVSGVRICFYLKERYDYDNRGSI